MHERACIYFQIRKWAGHGKHVLETFARGGAGPGGPTDSGGPIDSGGPTDSGGPRKPLKVTARIEYPGSPDEWRQDPRLGAGETAASRGWQPCRCNGFCQSKCPGRSRHPSYGGKEHVECPNPATSFKRVRRWRRWRQRQRHRFRGHSQRWWSVMCVGGASRTCVPGPRVVQAGHL